MLSSFMLKEKEMLQLMVNAIRLWENEQYCKVFDSGIVPFYYL